MIGLGEARVYRDLRASSMQSAAVCRAVTSNAATLPADLIELKEVYFSGKPPLDIIPLDRLRALEATATTGAPTPVLRAGRRHAALLAACLGHGAGQLLRQACGAGDGDVGEATTFARYPELFLYAALVEAMPFLGMEAKLQLWDAKFQQALERCAAI
jgi:hypothetical protein